MRTDGRYSFPVLMKFVLLRQIFEKSSKTKFHENASSENRVVPCGWVNGETARETDRQTDRERERTKLIVSFRTFANVPRHSKQ